MPDIRFECPNCAQHIAAPPEIAGDALPCPACGESISVPDGPTLALETLGSRHTDGTSCVADFHQLDSTTAKEESTAPPLAHSSESHANSEKTMLYVAMGIGIAIASCFVLFEESDPGASPYRNLAAAAFIIASISMLGLIRWYSAEHIKAKVSGIAFLVCGGAAALISYVFYWAFYAFAIEEVYLQRGVWIFKQIYVEQQYTNPVFAFLDMTGAVAGPIEELAKLAAVLLVPQVRRSIVDRRSGLYYAGLCALGFAMVENIAYFQRFGSVLLSRATPAHVVFAAIWGAAYGSWVSNSVSILGVARAMLYGIGLHALWNILASLDLTLFLIAWAATLWLGLDFIRKELQADAEQPLKRSGLSSSVRSIWQWVQAMTDSSRNLDSSPQVENDVKVSQPETPELSHRSSAVHGPQETPQETMQHSGKEDAEELTKRASPDDGAAEKPVRESIWNSHISGPAAMLGIMLVRGFESSPGLVVTGVLIGAALSAWLVFTGRVQPTKRMVVHAASGFAVGFLASVVGTAIGRSSDRAWHGVN